MNWGKGIILGMIVFMGFIISLVVFMIRSSDDNYDKDYYEKGINYNQEFKEKQQVLKDSIIPQLNLSNQVLDIKFKQAEKGIIYLKRPSNGNLDRQLNFVGKKVYIPLNKLKKGHWQIVINWYWHQKKYYYESKFFVE